MKAKLGSGFGGGTITTDPAGHYEAEVNKRGLVMGPFTEMLNGRWDNGWQLHSVFEQNGNTVVVWERRD